MTGGTPVEVVFAFAVEVEGVLKPVGGSLALASVIGDLDLQMQGAVALAQGEGFGQLQIGKHLVDALPGFAAGSGPSLENDLARALAEDLRFELTLIEFARPTLDCPEVLAQPSVPRAGGVIEDHILIFETLVEEGTHPRSTGQIDPDRQQVVLEFDNVRIIRQGLNRGGKGGRHRCRSENGAKGRGVIPWKHLGEGSRHYFFSSSITMIDQYLSSGTMTCQK